MDTIEVSTVDLLNIQKIIQVACTRGAYQAPEFTAVGHIVDKLQQYIQSAVTSKELEEGVKE